MFLAEVPDVLCRPSSGAGVVAVAVVSRLEHRRPDRGDEWRGRVLFDVRPRGLGGTLQLPGLGAAVPRSPVATKIDSPSVAPCWKIPLRVVKKLAGSPHWAQLIATDLQL